MRAKLAEAARALVGPMLLVALATAQLWPGIERGFSPPISWDHGAHLGKAMLTARELLPALRGWSDSVEAGVPLNTLYSVGSSAFILLVRALTAFASWPQSYAVAILSVRALVGLSIYRLVRAAGGGRAAAFFGGALALADNGDHSEGGWFYDIQFGVWPVSLAIAFANFGLADLVESRSRGREGLVPRAAVLFGFALLTHQMPLIGLCVLGPLYVGARALDADADTRGDLRAVVATMAAGAMIAAFWLVPMLAQSGAMARHGQLYRSFTELGLGATTGSFVLRGGAFTVVLCALATLRGLFSTGTRRFLAFATAAFLVLSARDWLVGTPILRYAPGLGSIMYPRFVMLAKPLEFALAGLLVGEVIALSSAELRATLVGWRGRVALVVAGLLVLPFSRGVVEGLALVNVRRDVAYTATDPLFEDFLAYAAWERAQPRDPFYRVAYANSESHLFQGAPAFTGRPAHKIGPLIAEVFGNATPSGSLEALRAMNVRRVVSVGRVPTTIVGHSHQVARFGSIRVDDLDAFDPAVAYDPTGVARPRTLSLERTRVVVAPNGARTVVVRRANAPRWRAWVDGREATVRDQPVEGAYPLRLMAVDVPPGSSRVEFEYDEAAPADLVGALLTALALAWLAYISVRPAAAAGAFARAAEAATRVAAPIVRRARPRVVVPVSVALLATAALVFLSRRGFDSRAALDTAEVSLVDATGVTRPCTSARRNGEPGVQCPGAEWQYVGRIVQGVAGELRECIWAHPAGPEERLIVRFPRAELGRHLEVGAGIADDAHGAGGHPVFVRVAVDGADVGVLTVPWESRWIERRWPVRPGAHDLTLTVTAQDASRRMLCFVARGR